VIRFGPFQVDPRTWTLSRDGGAVDLSPRLVEILGYLAARGGEIVTKEELLDRFWPGVNIADNTLTRAVADIRKSLGDDAGNPIYLQTAARRGYRFVGELPGVAAAPHLRAAIPIAGKAEPDEDPFKAWVKGRLALDSLDVNRLPGAVAAFEKAALELPSYAPAHAGLANAYLMQFERTRLGSVPDRALLTRAIAAAERACAIDPALGEGWATLGYLLSASGAGDEGQAAARRAAALEPDNWRHQFRLAYATWGEERLRAVDTTLRLKPGFAPARMLSAMVFSARGALDRAEREATLGADSQRQHRDHDTPLSPVGMHWLRGLIVAVRGDHAGALGCFDEEIAGGATGHIYGREFMVNARVAIGFTHLVRCEFEAAADAFHTALREAPQHPRATLGLYAIAVQNGDARGIDDATRAVDRTIAELRSGDRVVELSLVSAGAHATRGQASAAIAVLDHLLTTAPTGPAGWIIPVDPMLQALSSAPGFNVLLSKLAARAS
jgi:DNA-binding winged helix-turn-helix (wHTH) protein